MGSAIQRRVYEIMETAVGDDRASRFFDISIMTLILLNVLAVIMETVKPLDTEFAWFFQRFEMVSVIIFSTEYILRIWTCTQNERYRGALKGRIRYILSPMALVDLLAILPFYLPMIISLDLRFIRILRLLRVFRLLKIGRYSESLKKFGIVLKMKKEELGIAVFIVGFLLVFTSCIMYYVENEAQPEAFSSIPKAMWWGVATLTTVGYGDVYPITALGKVLGAMIAILGVGMVALPAGIIASGFSEQIKHRKDDPFVCPHCGKEIHRV